nr:guanylate kinase [Oceanococcus sp. HetDA_MAG_MS8]
MAQGILLILTAPSGAGKTTLAHRLIERWEQRGRQARFSVSYTTRSPRPGEQDGVDYHFVDDATFENMVQAGDFLEHAGVYGRRYGTGRAATESALRSHDLVILDIDWQGARQVREQWPEVLSVFIQPPSLEELERRLRGRGQDSDTVIASRMAQAEAELSHAGEFDVRIINADLDQALAELDQVLDGDQLQ